MMRGGVLFILSVLFVCTGVLPDNASADSRKVIVNFPHIIRDQINSGTAGVRSFSGNMFEIKKGKEIGWAVPVNSWQPIEVTYEITAPGPMNWGGFNQVKNNGRTGIVTGLYQPNSGFVQFSVKFDGSEPDGIYKVTAYPKNERPHNFSFSAYKRGASAPTFGTPTYKPKQTQASKPNTAKQTQEAKKKKKQKNKKSKKSKSKNNSTQNVYNQINSEQRRQERRREAQRIQRNRDNAVRQQRRDDYLSDQRRYDQINRDYNRNW